MSTTVDLTQPAVTSADFNMNASQGSLVSGAKWTKAKNMFKGTNARMHVSNFIAGIFSIFDNLWDLVMAGVYVYYSIDYSNPPITALFALAWVGFGIALGRMFWALAYAFNVTSHGFDAYQGSIVSASGCISLVRWGIINAYWSNFWWNYDTNFFATFASPGSLAALSTAALTSDRLVLVLAVSVVSTYALFAGTVAETLHHILASTRSVRADGGPQTKSS